VDRRLLDAALDLFITRGFAATSCEAVARQAEAGKASLYARFPNKNSLFEAVVRRQASTLPAVAETHPDLRLEERLRMAGRQMLDHALRPETLAMMRLVVATADRFPDLAVEASRIGWEGGRSSVRNAILSGPDRPADVDDVVEQFIDLVFAPHQLRALLGESREKLLDGVSSRVDHAMVVLTATGALRPTS
jgi:AcrR family transcriptional regulator